MTWRLFAQALGCDFGTHTRHLGAKFENATMVNDAINSSGGGEGILELT